MRPQISVVQIQDNGGSNFWTLSGSNLYPNNSGNVGIGNNVGSPGSKLSVSVSGAQSPGAFMQAPGALSSAATTTQTSRDRLARRVLGSSFMLIALRWRISQPRGVSRTSETSGDNRGVPMSVNDQMTTEMRVARPLVLDQSRFLSAALSGKMGIEYITTGRAA